MDVPALRLGRVLSGWDQRFDAEVEESESQRDWLLVLVQFVIILLLALLSMLAAVGISRMDDPQDIRIIPAEPQPQPQLEV